MSRVQVYVSYITGSRQIKSRQSEVERVLDVKKIRYDCVDISASETLLEEMRTRTGNPKALPPQIFNDDVYCGDYQNFQDAVENEELNQFLRQKEMRNLNEAQMKHIDVN
ncbi:SH3 domain-binding glutamic acid-rich-like protein 3 [Callorhinchus milii]|uniref:SH3 domain-binding glutamic acid-rich-like protein 3 n=1 Tax=Callorhinchus milii TaxID=7868 RepID=A0A4W3H1D1_CALMI|nr:SH3 domain-binding glutamic acid-rich-like protein 3 [Callorhinchus milii]|eukprot:gi/632985887/ref/XP_007909932.1/ PREDICTED: SH3 domain-binding glutamic acid-rich-like protein 3 [Callorhinchus milii]